MTIQPVRLFGDPILRAGAAEVTAFDRELRQLVTDLTDTVEFAAAGLLARCVQHETDHLDGVLFVDRLDPAARKEAMRTIRVSECFTTGITMRSTRAIGAGQAGSFGGGR